MGRRNSSRSVVVRWLGLCLWAEALFLGLSIIHLAAFRRAASIFNAWRAL